jgi:hypothetical protein
MEERQEETSPLWQGARQAVEGTDRDREAGGAAFGRPALETAKASPPLTFTKDEVLALAAEGRGCLGRAFGDEPVFVLRAKDPAAAMVVRIWCQLVRSLGLHEPDKTAEAGRIADDMEAWRAARFAPYVND